jgi:hypothetical protein
VCASALQIQQIVKNRLPSMIAEVRAVVAPHKDNNIRIGDSTVPSLHDCIAQVHPIAI